MAQTNDDILIDKLFTIKSELIKLLIEDNGDDLGDSLIHKEYHNYIINEQFAFNNLADYEFDTDIKVNDYSNFSKQISKDLNSKVSEHFTLKDLCVTSKCKIELNTPTCKEHLDSLVKLANELIEPIYQMTNGKISINSCYRNNYVNTLVGGSKTSQHSLGQAVDLRGIQGLSNVELFSRIFKMIENNKLKVGQLIWEGGNLSNPGWVHVSLPYRKVNQIIALAPTRPIGPILNKHGLSKSNNMT